MKKIYIGVLPTLKQKESHYEATHEYLTRYFKALDYPNVIIIPLIIIEQKPLKNQLDNCDAFCFPGGSSFYAGMFSVLEYAYTTKKPVLGICLGMQALAIYSLIKERNIPYQQAEQIALKTLPDNSHYVVAKKEGDLEASIHKIFLIPNSNLATYLGKLESKGYSFHHDIVIKHSNLFKDIAFSEDHILEAIESTDTNWLAIGVQFHPELDPEDKIIKEFINTIK